MAALTTNVSGINALRLLLSTATTQLYFTGAVDGQILTLTLQQDATGGRLVTSGNCPGLVQPSATANDGTTMTLIYDSSNNTWNTPVDVDTEPSMVLQTTTTNSSIAWTRGLYLISGAAATTLTITNPVSGPPGVGNDGEIMIFTNGTAHAHAITMATGTTVNKSSTTITTAAAIGNAVQLMAFGGNVYICGVQGTITLT
jgi:hypothetical protein